MPNQARIHAEKIVANPSSFFDHPMELVKSRQLTRDEKKAALENWELDSRLMSVASEEGMGGGEPALLDEVAEAKTALHMETQRPAGPTKLG